VAVQADDELLDALGTDPTPTDQAVGRALAAWRHDVDAESLPALLDVDTAPVARGRTSSAPRERIGA
jgi:hypothetical protein